MQHYMKYTCIVRLLILGMLFSGVQEHFSTWGQTTEPESNLLEITHGGQEQVLSEAEEDEPGAFTAGSFTGAEEPDAQYVFPMMRLHILVPSDIEGCEPGVYPVHLDVPEGVLLLDDAGENIPGDRDFAEETSVLVKATQPSQQMGDIEITAHSEECPGLGYDRVRATVLVVDLDAHWPGTIAEPGPLVNDEEEDDPLKLFLAVNDNDDNFDKIVDNNSTDSPIIDAEDRDIITIVVRKFVPPSPAEGTLELAFGNGLRMFSADGTQELTSPLSVDLTNPTGPLTNVMNHDVMFRVEAIQTADDVLITLVYTIPGQQSISDEVHMTNVNPQVTGGFTRGSVRYSAARDLPEEVKWAVCGELTVHHPLSILIPDPTDREKTKGTVSVRYGISTQLNDSGELDIPMPTTDAVQISQQYFQWQATIYNGIVAPLNAVLKVLGRPLLDTYNEDTLAEGLSQETGIDVETLKSGKYFVIQNLYEPGFAVVQYLFDGREIARDYGYVFRLDLDIHNGDNNASEVHDANEKTLGAITLANLNDTDGDGIIDKDDLEISTLLEKGDSDLMKLLIRKIEPTFLSQNIQGEVALYVKPGSVELWGESRKKAENYIHPGDREPEESIYIFSLADLEKTLWVEATEPGHIKIDLEFLGAKDTVWATAHWGDLDIDSDNNDGTDLPPDWTRTEIEDRIENDPDRPGKLIMVNDGDLDNDGVPDFADSEILGNVPGTLVVKHTPLILELPESFDVSKAQVRFHYSAAPEVLPVNSPVYTPGDDGHLRMRAGNITVNYIEPNVIYPASALGSSRIMTFFLEGIRPTTSPDDQRIVVEIDYNGDEDGENFVVADVVRVTVVHVDLDIDSDNADGFDIPIGVVYDEEDHVEDIQGDAARPGKFIVANMGDADEDNVPDFADNDITAKDGNEPVRFTPMTLSLPEPLKLEQTKIRFMYSDSDPTNVRTGAGTQDDPYVYTPAPGHIRIWKNEVVQEDGTIARQMKSVEDGGHFVKANTVYDATAFGAKRTLLFYVEGIDGTSEIAKQHILVEVAPNGNEEEPDFLGQDSVRMTVIKLAITEVHCPNGEESSSFTTQELENIVHLVADIKPDVYDRNHDNQIEWIVQDDTRDDYISLDSGRPLDDPPHGHETSFEITIPPIPKASETGEYGRNWHRLSFKIQAHVVIEQLTIPAMPNYIVQDEIDMLRQQYIDMEKEVPGRDGFINEGHSSYFDLSDGACPCGNHEYHLWSIMENLDDVLTNINNSPGRDVTELGINSGYRCPLHNDVTVRKQGYNPSPTSPHMYGVAADIAAEDWNNNGSRADDVAALDSAARAEPAGATDTITYSNRVHVEWEE